MKTVWFVHDAHAVTIAGLTGEGNVFLSDSFIHIFWKMTFTIPQIVKKVVFLKRACKLPAAWLSEVTIETQRAQGQKEIINTMRGNRHFFPDSGRHNTMFSGNWFESFL